MADLAILVAHRYHLHLTSRMFWVHPRGTPKCSLDGLYQRAQNKTGLYSFYIKLFRKFPLALILSNNP